MGRHGLQAGQHPTIRQLTLQDRPLPNFAVSFPLTRRLILINCLPEGPGGKYVRFFSIYTFLCGEAELEIISIEMLNKHKNELILHKYIDNSVNIYIFVPQL